MFSQIKKMDPRRVFYLLSGGMALIHALIYTTYTVYYFKGVGMDPLQLVLVGTMLEASCLALEVPTGVLADTYSRRLSVILGIFCLGVAALLVGAAPLFAVVLAGQVVSALGYTLMSGAVDAWLADEIGEQNVGPVYLRSGQIERLFGIGGIAASVALASAALNLPFLAGGALFLLLGTLLAGVMSEGGFKPQPRAKGKKLYPLQNMTTTFQVGVEVVRGRPVLILLLLANLSIGAASEGFDRLGDAHLLEDFSLPGLGALQPVVWFGILGICATLFSLLVTELFRRRLEGLSNNLRATAWVLTGLQSLLVAAVIVFGAARSFSLAFTALMAKAAADALSAPLYTTWLVQNVGSRARATVLSMASQTNALGQTVVGPGVGAIGSLISLRAAILAAGVLFAPAAGLYAHAARGALANGEDTKALEN